MVLIHMKFVIIFIIIGGDKYKKGDNMVRYAIVRYTKEIVDYVDGEEMAKAIAKGYAKRDYTDIEAWYSIEPDHVY